MNHNEIQNKLLLYIDGNLSKPEMESMREHINFCSGCRERLKGFEKIWKLEGEEKAEPSPYMWTRLEAEIKEYEQNPVSFDLDYIRKRFVYILQPAVIVVLIFVSVITGYYSGNYLSKDMNGDQDISNNEQVAKVFYLDSLEPLTIEYNGNGEEVLNE